MDRSSPNTSSSPSHPPAPPGAAASPEATIARLEAELAELRRHEDILTQCLSRTQTVTGQAALQQLIVELGEALGTQRAHISLVEPRDPTKMASVAYWSDGQWGSANSFSIAGTASEQVVLHGPQAYWHDLAERFPHNRATYEEWNIDSYLGAPLHDAAGAVRGVIAILFGHEPESRRLAETLLRLFALRASAELQRLDAEEARRASERELQELFDHTREILFTIRIGADKRFRYERLNRRCLEISNLVGVDVHGHTPAELYPREVASAFEMDYRRCLTARIPITFEQHVALATGSQIFDTTLIPFFNAEGRVDRIAGFARDITEIRRHQALLEQTQTAAHIGGWDLDCSTGRMLWSSGVYHLLGRDPQTFTPNLPATIACFAPESQPAISAAIERAIADGTPYDLNLVVVAPEGDRREVRALGQAGCDGKRVLRIFGAIQDISALQQTRHRQARLESQLRQSQKLEALGRLAGGIAHDFNNILTGVIGNTQLAELELPPDCRAGHYLENSLRACERARALVRQILSFSRQSEPPRTIVELKPVVIEAAQLLKPGLSANIRLVTDLAPAPLHIRGDAGQVHQVIMNLGANAAHAMRETGGVLTIALESLAPDPELRAAHPQLRPEHTVRLRVRDTGAGMDGPTRERIFEPFFSTKPTGEGSGLGLAMVHGIVESHGGTIVVESAPGQGSTFDLYFPGQPAPATPPPATPPVPTTTPRRILLVDDEPSIIDVAGIMLTRLGYQPSPHGDAASALAAFRAAPDAYHAVISDLSMPRMSGADLAREILAIRPDIPFVIITGFMQSNDIQRARALGVRHFLTKPFSIDRFAALLRQLSGNPSA